MHSDSGSVPRGAIQGPYTQKSVKKRIEALFLDNLGRVITREQILEVAKDPTTGREPENWHQRLSELRTDDGYTILSWRDTPNLRVQEYLMPDATQRVTAAKRVRPTRECWGEVLRRAGNKCEWNNDGDSCPLHIGDIDPIGGGTVILTPDHRVPHSIKPDADPTNPDDWQALCARHQVMKKNYWDSSTGKLNIYGILQSVTKAEKTAAFTFLLDYFGYILGSDGEIKRKR